MSLALECQHFLVYLESKLFKHNTPRLVTPSDRKGTPEIHKCVGTSKITLTYTLGEGLSSQCLYISHLSLEAVVFPFKPPPDNIKLAHF